MYHMSSSYMISRPSIIHLAAGMLLSLFALIMVSPAIGQSRSEVVKTGLQQCEVKEGLVILVQFPDVNNRVDRRYPQRRFFRELNEYVREMTHGQVCIRGDVTDKWHRMPGPISEYRISSRNLEVDKSRIRKLIAEALDAVDKEVNISRYSFIAIFLGAQVREYGMVGLCGYPGMLGWSAGDVLKTKSGQVVKGGIAIFSYQAHLGTLFHDVAHILGGVKDGKRMVPCLYDHDLQAKPGPMRETFVEATINMGFWDPMSCHYCKWEVPPPGISSWTKIRLNWLDQSKIQTVKPGERTEVLLGPLEDDTSGTQAIKIPITDSTYYLIENRQPLGSDRNLPGSGILIIYGDDKVAECRHGRSPVKLVDADPSVLHLEGAAFDMGKKEVFVDDSKGLKIQLLEKVNKVYKILVTRSEK